MGHPARRDPAPALNAFDQHLTARLAAIEAAGLHRELRRVDSVRGNRLSIAGVEYLDFSSNDYLGLARVAIGHLAAVGAVDRPRRHRVVGR